MSVGSAKQRALLAVLLLSAGETVSRERLIDELWADDPPATAAKIVQTYVSRLRKVSPAGTLVTRPPGYAIELGEGQLDLERFEQLAADGRGALETGDVMLGASLLRDALALWRGPALSEFETEPFAQGERARLEELRVGALGERISADLILGRHPDLVGELAALVARHPLREKLRGQLMLSLYRSGRQAEALAVYQDARRVLVDELGIEPGEELQELQQAILRHDRALDVEAPPQPQDGSAAAVDAPADGLVPEPPRQVFVGRESELNGLVGLLHETLAGRGQLVLVAGEPGIGKTRIAREIGARADEAGLRVHWGRCFEREGAPPFWPWVQALRDYARTAERAQLSADLGPGAPEIAEVVAEVREQLADIPAPAAYADPKQARFRQFDSIAAFLRRVADRQPLMLVLEDLHWADRDSLALLEFVTAELAQSRVLIVGTYRDVEVSRGHPLAETLAELTRESQTTRLALDGLSQTDVGSFLQHAFGPSRDDELAATVHERTDGNPLFVTEIIRLLSQEGQLVAGDQRKRHDLRFGIPDEIREVIGKRLDRLSGPCSDTLTVAAVVGREFGLDELAPLVDDLSDEGLLDLLEEALHAYIVEELPEVGRYQFTHALIQEVLAQELSQTRRVRLHARVATALEDLYGADANAHAARLARHFTEAGSLLGAEKLRHYSLVAAERALTAHAYEEAINHFERARDSAPDGADEIDNAGLFFGLARAELGARELFDVGHAIDYLCRAFDLYVSAGEPRKAVEVVAQPLPPSTRRRRSPSASRARSRWPTRARSSRAACS